MIPARRPFRPALRRGRILQALGLPRNARWPDASKALKTRLVEARRRGDEEEQRALSLAKAFLRRNLPTECGCGNLVGRGLRCQVCAIPIQADYNRRRKGQAG